LQEIPVPTIGDNDLLVKVRAAGFCHTDYQVYEGVYQSKLPLTPSHEPVGTVVAVGQHAARQNWLIGQRVGVLNFRHACGVCSGCKTFRESPMSDKPDIRVCKNKEMAGISHDGGFAEYIVADADTTTLLPDGLTFEQAAPLMCAGVSDPLFLPGICLLNCIGQATVWSGIRAAQLSSGLPVAVIGIGGLGQLAIQFLKALGHPTIAIDNRPEGLELSREIGLEELRADTVVDYHSDDATEKVLQFGAEGGGVAGVVVCTDDVAATKWSLTVLRPRGVAVVLGLPTDGFHFSAFDLVFKELVVRGSLVANKTLVDEMMTVVDKHNVRSHVTVVDLKDAPRLPELYMNKHLKGRLVLKM
jgi:D-arabinose 1-dehydrogenase-like Zn-dependent alcohol dehydrogenase